MSHGSTTYRVWLDGYTAPNPPFPTLEAAQGFAMDEAGRARVNVVIREYNGAGGWTGRIWERDFSARSG